MKSYQIRHLTRYSYQHAVANSYNLLCLQPLSDHRQQLSQFSLAIDPQTAPLYEQQDWFGNHKQLLHLPQSHQGLCVVASSVLQVSPDAERQYSERPWSEALVGSAPAAAVDLQACLCSKTSPMLPQLAGCRAFIQPLAAPDLSVVQLAAALSEKIYRQFDYDPGFSSVATPLTEVLHHKKGVCQDFAHLAIACLRSLGLSARYVSGYLETEAPPGQPKLTGADASHAWFEVWCPDSGWVGFDPTNNLQPNGRHLVLARGRDYSDVVPLKGLVLGHGDHQLEVEVDVMPIPAEFS